MLIIESKLENLACIKNARGCSICNPSEIKIGVINFGAQTLACCRVESTSKVEEGIKKLRA